MEYKAGDTINVSVKFTVNSGEVASVRAAYVPLDGGRPQGEPGHLPRRDGILLQGRREGDTATFIGIVPHGIYGGRYRLNVIYEWSNGSGGMNQASHLVDTHDISVKDDPTGLAPKPPVVEIR